MEITIKNLFLIFSVLLVILGSASIWIGYHNIDIAYNILNLNENLTDISIGGLEQNSQEAYGSGIKFLFMGYFLMVIGFCLLLLYSKTEEKNERML